MIGQECNKCPEYGRFGDAQGIRDRDDHSWCKLCRRDNARSRYQGRKVAKGDIPPILTIARSVQSSLQALEGYIESGESDSTIMITTLGIALDGLKSVMDRLEELQNKAEKATGSRTASQDKRPLLSAYLQDLWSWTSAGRMDKVREIKDLIARDYPTYENTWENLEKFIRDRQ